MKKIILWALIIFAIGFFVFVTSNKPSFHGVIVEIEDDMILVGPLKENGKMQSDINDIQFTDETEVTGDIENISGLKKGQEVQVWGEEEDKGFIATKIDVKIK